MLKPKTMRTKLLIALPAIALVVLINSCRKDAGAPDTTAPAAAPQNMAALHARMTSMGKPDAFAVHFNDALKDKCRKLTKRLDDVKHQTESFISRCKQHPGKSHHPDLDVIYVPRQYPTLQAAVDIAPAGARIIVCGTVAQTGNVLINTANLSIEGQQESATLKDSNDSLSTDNLVITASGVTVKNLKLVNVGIQVNDPATGVTLAHDKVINNNLDNPSIITLTNSSHNKIKDCCLNGAGINATAQVGILLDSLSTRNEITGCSVNNTDFAAYNITGSNNLVKHCSASNYNLGFVVWNLIGTSTTGNVFTDCNADNCAQGTGFLLYANQVSVYNCSANNCVNAVLNVSQSSIIDHCSGNKCFQAFISYFANELTLTHCSASECAYSGIDVELSTSFKLTHNTCNGSTGSGIVINNYNGSFSKGIITDNNTNSNVAFGIYLNSVANSTIRDNKSLRNTQCDFNQTNCSANLVAHNQFGTTAVGL
ncbi:MAG: right-handed parallel beta-helix repeat-containing protein [Sphingobacteriales bacterium]